MKTNLLSGMLTAMIMMGTLTSCENIFIESDYVTPTGQSMDRKQSAAFAGQWTGDFGAFYTYSTGYNTYRYDSYDTDVVFYPEYNGATYGWGKEVDFYEYGPYEYIYHKFDWEIRDGIVYLTYYNDASMDCWIRDYNMTNDYFSGYFGNSSNSFRLIKIADYYNWTPYVNTYSYGERREWYGARMQENSAEADTTETAQPAPEEGSITFGNRFNQ